MRLPSGRSIALNEIEGKVLAFLAESYGYDCGYWGFTGIMQNTQLDRKQVRRACRSLARKGLAEYLKGLWSDEGPAGAGYGSTLQGRELIHARENRA